jgi:RimJ/RimL family protein N-acetyltransferase
MISPPISHEDYVGSFTFHRIIGRCDARNNTSARLMERLGMRQEAHFHENEIFKGEWSDEYVYALLAGEWSARGTYSGRT